MSRKKGRSARRAAATRRALAPVLPRQALFDEIYRGEPVYNKDLDYEVEEGDAYLNEILQIAMTRFEWIDLPPTVDQRYLELYLLFNGAVSLASPRALSKMLVATSYITEGRPNLYGNPTKWRAFAPNGWNFDVDNSTGVIVYDNLSRIPVFRELEILAKRLARIDRTFDLELKHQRVPWLIKGPREREIDMINTLKSAFGGEPAVMVDDGYNATVEPLLVKSTFEGEALQIAQEKVWGQVYRVLGIDFISRKKERMIEDEVAEQAGPTSLRAMHALAARRAAADRINRIYGLDIKVVWRTDNESANYEITHNLPEYLDATNHGKMITDAMTAKEGGVSVE